MRFGENNRRAFLGTVASGLSAFLLGSGGNQTTNTSRVRVDRDAIQRAQKADAQASTVVKIAPNGAEFNSKGEEVTEDRVTKVQERSDRRKEIDENVGLLEARQNDSDHELEKTAEDEGRLRRFAAMGGLGLAGLNAILPSSDREIKESINEVDKLYLTLGKITSGKATKEDLCCLLPYVTSVTDTRDRWDENFPEEYLKILELELDFSSLKNSTVSKLAPITIEIASNRDQKIIFGNSASASNNQALLKEELNTILRNLTKISDQDKELIKKLFQIHDPSSDPVADLSIIGENIEKHSNSEIIPSEKYNAPTPTVKLGSTTQKTPLRSDSTEDKSGEGKPVVDDPYEGIVLAGDSSVEIPRYDPTKREPLKDDDSSLIVVNDDDVTLSSSPTAHSIEESHPLFKPVKSGMTISQALGAIWSKDDEEVVAYLKSFVFDKNYKDLYKPGLASFYDDVIACLKKKGLGNLPQQSNQVITNDNDLMYYWGRFHLGANRDNAREFWSRYVDKMEHLQS